ncbi:type VII secretion protein EssB [Streptococcus plurextorum]|uniref:type VII secretion protein EssB n=1 Tax=Streptococcus plurextorum TaxID=456876 RepID=UPI0004089000|nr:type VII secretion protein EssB [Streptococcus plurextorum]
MENLKRQLLHEDIKGNREVAFALLTAEHPYFVAQTIQEEGENLILESILSSDSYDWSVLESLYTEEKLRHLLNVSAIFDTLKDTKYSYHLSPDTIIFNRNAEPLLLVRGVKGQVPPYESVTDDDFLIALKAMIISLLDKRTSYEGLMEGKLPFYKGNLFCESIAKAENLADVQALLSDKYIEEKRLNQENFSRVGNKVVSRLKLTTIVSSITAFISLLGVLYFLLFAIPGQETISELRLAFVQQDYSRVVSTVKNSDAKSLSIDDKYIVAYSVIMTEPLTEEQKTELSKLSTQSNEDYLRYWVLIGQAKVDEAMDIASYLDDPQLMMYGLTKKIDEVQRDPDLTAESRTEQLNNYKGKLEELKKTYLVPEQTEMEQETTTTTTSTTTSN